MSAEKQERERERNICSLSCFSADMSDRSLSDNRFSEIHSGATIVRTVKPGVILGVMAIPTDPDIPKGGVML